MSERIRAILAVIVLTIAVWVWADLEQTDRAECQVDVKVVVPPDYKVRSITPDHLIVSFAGPRRQVQDLLASPPEEKECRFSPSEAELKNGRLALHARDGFEQWTKRGLMVTAMKDDRDTVTDREIQVVVDHIARLKNVPVMATVPQGVIASVSPAEPPHVDAQVAESQLKGLPAAKQFAVAAVPVDRLSENQSVTLDVPLEPRLGGADGIEATFDPSFVRVTARLQSKPTSRVFPRMPVLISATEDVLRRYRIVFQQPDSDLWVELEVQGPAPDVERLKPQDLRVLLVVTSQHTPNPGSWLPGELAVVGLPPNVKLTKPLPAINFNLERLPEKPPAVKETP
jgi:hypothetical protein